MLEIAVLFREGKRQVLDYLLRLVLGALPLAAFSYLTLMRLGEITEVAARFSYYPAVYVSFFLFGYLVLSLAYLWFFSAVAAVDFWVAARIEGLIHLTGVILLPYLFAYDLISSRMGFSLFYMFLLISLGLRLYALAKNTREEKRPILALAGIIVAGTALRFALLFTSQGVVGSEEAIMGLMARHMLFDRETYVFLWGQPYMGSLEALLAAPIFFLFGASSLTLKVVPLVFSLFFIVAAYFLAKVTLGEDIALISASLLSISPVFLTVFSMLANAYIENLFYGAVVLMLACLVAYNSEGRRQLYLFLLLGLVSGVAFWNNLTSLVYLTAAFLFLALEWRRWSSAFLPKILLFLGGGIFGSLPLWVFNFRHQWITFRFLTGGLGTAPSWEAKATELLTNLRNLLGVMKVIVDGGRGPLTNLAVYSIYIASLLYAFYYFAAKMRSGDQREANGIKIFLIFTLILTVFFSVSRYGGLNEARYVLTLYLSLPVFLGLLVRDVGRKSSLAATALLAVVLFCNLLGNINDAKKTPPQPALIASFLNKNSIPYVYTDFWNAYQLTFVSKERILSYAISGPNVYPPYVEKIRAADPRQVAVIFSKGKSFESFEAELHMGSVSYQKTKLAGKTVFYDFSQKIDVLLGLSET